MCIDIIPDIRLNVCTDMIPDVRLNVCTGMIPNISLSACADMINVGIHMIPNVRSNVHRHDSQC